MALIDLTGVSARRVRAVSCESLITLPLQDGIVNPVPAPEYLQ
jgi:hypothetical protein